MPYCFISDLQLTSRAFARAFDLIGIGDVRDLVVSGKAEVAARGEQERADEELHLREELQHGAHHLYEGGVRHELFGGGIGAVVAGGAVEQKVFHALGILLGDRDGDVAAHGMPGDVPGLVGDGEHKLVHQVLSGDALGVGGLAGGVAEVRQVHDHGRVAVRLQRLRKPLEAIGGEREAVDQQDSVLFVVRPEQAVVQGIVSGREKPAVVKGRFGRSRREGEGREGEAG